MSFSKTIGTILSTILIGSVTFLFSLPKKTLKSKVKVVKSRSAKEVEPEENLFI